MTEYNDTPFETDEEIEQRYLSSLQEADEKREHRRLYGIQKSLAYQKKHPEKTRLYARRTYNKHPERSILNYHRYRSRKRNLPDTWTKEHWKFCLDYWHHCCAVCGKQLRDLFGEIKPHADHWIPVSYQGEDNPGTVPENMICLCSKCNFSKHDYMPTDWLISRYGKRKANKILKRINGYFELASKRK